MTLLEIVLVLGSAACAALIGVVILASRKTQVIISDESEHARMSFLFRDCDLEHASPEGRALLSTTKAETDWHALRSALLSRFPEFPDDEAVRQISTIVVPANNTSDSGIVQIQREAELIRVDVCENGTQGVQTVHLIQSMQERAELLDLATDTSPSPIWTIEHDGTVSWYNAAYGELLEKSDGHDSMSPLFDVTNLANTDGGSVRTAVKTQKDQKEIWFDVTLTKRGARSVCHATDINAVIQAEVAQRNFVQTLAKTFAQLSIGLAIFDRSGQLALFNPALVGLTSLPIEFLSSRPDLLTFFDRLRDNRVMPEPKNYMSWRHEITDLIAAATHSSYEETWSLDSGRTYRINGRPHPDGAVAFLVEDISAEISLTRNFRAELEMSKSMMDSFDDALAVFSSTGVLTYCNLAYRDMWKIDLDASFVDVTIHDSEKLWKDQCLPNSDFQDVRDFVFLKNSDRARWETELKLKNDESLIMQITPIAAGATMIRFSEFAKPSTFATKTLS